MTPISIGSIGAYGPAGRLGQIVGRQTVAQSDPDTRIVALRVRTVEPLRPEEAGVGARPSAAPRVAEAAPTIASRGSASPRSTAAAKTPDRLNPEEKAVVDRLRQRDGQVRQEEQAHAAAAGDLAGAIEYTYQLGPDGRRYAVGGAVPLRANIANVDPAQAARIGARLSAAGQAAANPSGADLAVALQGYGLSAGAGSGGEKAQRPGHNLDIRA